MQACKGCGNAAGADWFGDPWCDPCGGIAGRPGWLLMRHVATVDGEGCRLPIVWDVSQGYYKFRHPNKVNPRYVKAMKEAEERKKKGLEPRKLIETEFSAQPILTISHESLDAVIAMSQPIARGDSDEWPELSAAPTATKSERSLMRL